ncbi:MAG: hypothetical protein R3F43_29945 [bacterium]
MTRIFTTAVVLAWLYRRLVLLASWRDAFAVDVGGNAINLIYLVPTLSVIAKVMRQEATGRIYALKTPVDRALVRLHPGDGLIILSKPLPWRRRGAGLVRLQRRNVFSPHPQRPPVTHRRSSFYRHAGGHVTLMSPAPSASCCWRCTTARRSPARPAPRQLPAAGPRQGGQRCRWPSDASSSPRRCPGASSTACRPWCC